MIINCIVIFNNVNSGIIVLFTTIFLSQYTFTGPNKGTPINLHLVLNLMTLFRKILIATN